MLRKKKITSSKRAARKRKGQSTIEYIILVVIVIAAALAFKATFQTTIEDTVGNVAEGMTNMAARHQLSRP